MADSVSSSRPARIALVGDRSEAVHAHVKIPRLIEALSLDGGSRVEIYWLHSASLTDAAHLAGFDGIWAVPGSPYENTDGVLTAVGVARTSDIPFLGTCGGFQHMLLEFARNVCGLADAESTESSPDATCLLITPLECSLLGEEATVTIKPGTRAAQLMGAGSSTERFFCRYGLNPEFQAIIEQNGMVLSGSDELGDARIAELPGHPFFIGTLFQPELSSDATWVHPVIAGFVSAARERASVVTLART
jgi:CTP synthase (UTP-ammonia lyase)